MTLTRLDLTLTMTVEVEHVAGKFASKTELASHVADLLVESLEEMDDAEITTLEDAEYRVARTLYLVGGGDA